jgi:fibronectin type 3 domain-containing protein
MDSFSLHRCAPPQQYSRRLTCLRFGECDLAEPTVSGYNVYRGTATGGPYTLIGSATGLTYTDRSVSAGGTYYYVTAAKDSNGDVSAYSNQAQATIPTP